MVTKNEIKDIIGTRIERFNKLWFKALGYTFEEEPEIEQKKYEDAMHEWNTDVNPKLQARCKELGYENDNEYLHHIWESDDERDPIVQGYWDKRPSSPSPLYDYEMSVISEAKNIAFWFIDTFPGCGEEKWKELAGDGGAFAFVDKIKSLGYDKWNEGHSGNSGSMAVLFAYTMLFQTDLFPYQHGALSYLVGDTGYYDDRSDVHAAVEAFKNKNKVQ